MKPMPQLPQDKQSPFGLMSYSVSFCDTWT